MHASGPAAYDHTTHHPFDICCHGDERTMRFLDEDDYHSFVWLLCQAGAHAGGPTVIARWAKSKEAFLRKLLSLPAGIPCKDVFRRVLMLLKPGAVQACFYHWLRALRTAAAATAAAAAAAAAAAGEACVIEQPVFAVDGKTNRRSHDHANGLGAVHY